MRTIVESSSDEGKDFVSEGEKRAETKTEGPSRAEVEQALAKAFPGIKAERVDEALRDSDPASVIHATTTYRPKGRGNEWGWFLGICRKTKAAGGPPPTPAARLSPAEEKRQAWAVAFKARQEKRRLQDQASAESKASEAPAEPRPLRPSEKVPITYHKASPRQPIPESERGKPIF